LTRDIPTLDAVLQAHALALGGDLTGYRNHTYRVANLCLALSAESSGAFEKIAIAAAFHDLGIWTHRTFDYIQPSIDLATAHLSSTGRSAWITEIAAMIREHHRISPCRGAESALVETFRRADWIDVTRGVLTFGVPRRLVRELYATWPDAGFHARLLQLSLQRLRTHPLNPLPMVRW
jgi:hypothetical protein